MAHKRVYNSCPLCGHSSKIRSSKQYTKEVKEIWLGCTNDECGHVYVVTQAFQRSISKRMPVQPSV